MINQPSHRKSAEHFLREIGNTSPLDGEGQRRREGLRRTAELHAYLAIAEALQGIWHELEELNVRVDR